MCTSVYSTLVLFLTATTFIISLMCGTKMTAEGLPFRRRERGVDQDILAGEDFLSVLMSTSFRKEYQTTTTPVTEPTTIFEIEDLEIHYNPQSNVLRPSRSTSSFAQVSTEQHRFRVSDGDFHSDNSDIKDAVVLAVRVSSSVGKPVKRGPHPPISSNNLEDTTLSETIALPPTTEMLEQAFVASQEHPTIVAKASKSELSVEESDPITKDSDLDYASSYPAKIQPLPRQQQSSYDPTAGFLSQNIHQEKQPYHQTVIYHDNPHDPVRSRSVSYSSIIQALPQNPEETEKPLEHERHERNYNGAQTAFANHFNDDNSKNDSKIFPDNRSGFVTRIASVTESWQKPESSLKKLSITTERNWETQEKPYMPPSTPPNHLPKIYGQPEQNYEVDEVISVVTNGRAHGIQPSSAPKPEKKPDDNQKMGYVVEGRNYRKYRVEERTADGFIVGEYGVVSHDDGSLRGVRYTADGTINPRVISEALMKFLSL